MTSMWMGWVRLVTWKRINKIRSKLRLVRHFVMINCLGLSIEANVVEFLTFITIL